MDGLQMMSFPTRERGLKFNLLAISMPFSPVVPHAGTWIEICNHVALAEPSIVVPHAGTWIEILTIQI